VHEETLSTHRLQGERHVALGARRINPKFISMTPQAPMKAFSKRHAVGATMGLFGEAMELHQYKKYFQTGCRSP